MSDFLPITLTAIIAAVIGYTAFSAYVRTWISFEPYPLAVCVMGTFLTASMFEVGFGMLHEYLWGWRLWEYHVRPVHEAYGSYFAPILWSFYGLYVYIVQQVQRLKKWKVGVLRAGLQMGFDGPCLEIVGNLIFLGLFGRFIFYYFPNDLWHLTSFWAVPYYMLGGMILFFVLRYLNGCRKNWLLPTTCLLLGLMFVASG